MMKKKISLMVLAVMTMASVQAFAANGDDAGRYQDGSYCCRDGQGGYGCYGDGHAHRGCWRE